MDYLFGKQTKKTKKNTKNQKPHFIKLKNNLEAIIIHNPNYNNKLDIHLCIKVGSIYDTLPLQGMSHLLDIFFSEVIN